MVGRIVPQKALHTIFYALKILKERGQTDIQLYLVGDGDATGGSGSDGAVDGEH